MRKIFLLFLCFTFSFALFSSPASASGQISFVSESEVIKMVQKDNSTVLYFDSLQSAINFAATGDVITVLGGNHTAVVKYAKTFTVNCVKEAVVTLSAAPGYILQKNGNVYSCSVPKAGERSFLHTISVPSAINGGSVSASPKTVEEGKTVSLSVSPTSGYVLDEIVVVQKNGDLVPLTSGSKNTFSFVMPNESVTVKAFFVEETVAATYRFSDVRPCDYYFDAVQWAAGKGVASGIDSSHFAPKSVTNRGQMVTFLWRAFDCPSPKSRNCPFADVQSDAYYYNAVLWAVENGIVKGTSDTTFSPNTNVNRGQSITFLARASGVKDNDAGYGHPFEDVKETDFFNNAVAWAKENGIADGSSSTRFEPYGPCLRGQVVTFLFRCFGEKT